MARLGQHRLGESQISWVGVDDNDERGHAFGGGKKSSWCAPARALQELQISRNYPKLRVSAPRVAIAFLTRELRFTISA
jgi:hypothetical protein